MSFEFNSKVQNLTTKLQGLQQNSKKETDLEDLKDQLRKLNESLQKELTQAEKRILRVENKLARREDASKRSQMAIDSVWNGKDEKVSEIIGGWVEQYEEKAEHARTQLMREEMNYQIKLQEEQQVIGKEVRMHQNHVKDLIHILQKEIAKLNAINSQNYTAISKEIISAKQTLSDGIAHTDQLKTDKVRQIQRRMSKMKETIKTKCNSISEDIGSKSTKLKHVMKLLLQID